jgi:hemoglobin
MGFMAKLRTALSTKSGRTFGRTLGATLMATLMACAVPVQAQSSESFYDGLGGEAGIKKIVDIFLTIILVDPRIAEQFKELDQPRFVAKLAEQFCQLSGGPCQYSGKAMKDIHDGMNITHAQFNALAEDLQLAMEKQAIPNRIQNKLVAKLAPMQREIVTK